MDVSENNGTPKSSSLIGFSFYKPSILGYPYFRKPPIYYISSWGHPGVFAAVGFRDFTPAVSWVQASGKDSLRDGGKPLPGALGKNPGRFYPGTLEWYHFYPLFWRINPLYSSSFWHHFKEVLGTHFKGYLPEVPSQFHRLKIKRDDGESKDSPVVVSLVRWVEPTHLKNMIVKMGENLPQIFGVKIKHMFESTSQL